MASEIQKIERRKIIIDMNAVFPGNHYTPETVAAILRDLIALTKFCEGMPAVSVYPIQTKIILNPISLAPSLGDIKQ